MATLNRYMIIGRLVQDPEKVVFDNGSVKVRGSVATNRTWKDKNGEKKEESFFIDYQLWGPQGEILEKFGKKGKEIYVDGILQNETWEKDGEKKSKITLKVDNFQFLGKAGGDSEEAEKSEEQPKKTAVKSKSPY